MNAAPLEHFERWDIHKEGTQPAVRRVTDALDAERIAVREALGYAAPHFPLADHYAREGEEWIRRTSRHSLRILGTVGEPINPDVWLWYYDHVGEQRCPVVDTWWQTETGGILITPIPGATPLKP